jgi:serine/threonine-protein kinase
MSLFANMRAERLIAEIKATAEGGERDNRKALERLSKLGPAAIPRIIDALANADKQETAGFVSVLSAMLDNRTFGGGRGPDGNQRTVAAIVWALAAEGLRTALLLPVARIARCPRPGRERARGAEIPTQCARTAKRLPAGTRKAAMFHHRGDRRRAIVPDLLSRLGGKDPISRVHIINILSRFNTPRVAAALRSSCATPIASSVRRS